MVRQNGMHTLLLFLIQEAMVRKYKFRCVPCLHAQIHQPKEAFHPVLRRLCRSASRRQEQKLAPNLEVIVENRVMHAERMELKKELQTISARV